MITSLALMSIYKAPAVPLSEICERYFALSYEEAMKAGLGAARRLRQAAPCGATSAHPSRCGRRP